VLDNLASHLAAAVENQRWSNAAHCKAFQDQLTGLPNRIRFTADIAQALESADPDAAYGVAVFGVDSVVAVNDSSARRRRPADDRGRRPAAAGCPIRPCRWQGRRQRLCRCCCVAPTLRPYKRSSGPGTNASTRHVRLAS